MSPRRLTFYIHFHLWVFCHFESTYFMLFILSVFKLASVERWLLQLSKDGNVDKKRFQKIFLKSEKNSVKANLGTNVLIYISFFEMFCSS